jgi:alpha-1,2-mannosyltransferase
VPVRCEGSIRPALLAAVGVLVLAVLFTARVSRKMPDLEVYWTAAVRARAAEPLYRVEDQHYQFKYLPAFAVLAIPGGMVPLPVAKAIWYVVSVALLAVLVALSPSLLPERRRPAWVLVVIAVVAMAKFFAHEVVLGQVNALLAVIVVAALVAIRRGNERTAGLLLALAVVVKPYAVIFLPWLMARRRWNAAVAASAVLAAILALPAFVYGWSGNLEQHRAWWKTVTESTAPNLVNADNVSVAGMFAKWLGAGPAAAALALATSLCVLAAAAFVFVKRRRVAFPEGLEGALLLTCIPLLSPQGWDYVFLLSTPAIVCLANYEDRLPKELRMLTVAAVAAIAFSVYDVMGRAAYSAFMSLSVITVCYLVVITALVVLRLRAVA